MLLALTMYVCIWRVYSMLSEQWWLLSSVPSECTQSCWVSLWAWFPAAGGPKDMSRSEIHTWTHFIPECTLSYRCEAITYQLCGGKVQDHDKIMEKTLESHDLYKTTKDVQCKSPERVFMIAIAILSYKSTILRWYYPLKQEWDLVMDFFLF